jgi:hypothetical protein
MTHLAAAFAGLFLVAPTPADTRSEIDATLAAMSAAVRAGDKAAYLRHVDMRDPEFAAEQRHWADDLDRHTPPEFELEVLDRPENADDDLAAGADQARMTLRMTYRASTGHAAAERGKRAVWPAVFRRHDPDADGPEASRWLYAGEEWIEAHGEYAAADGTERGSFSVKYLAGSEKVAEQVLLAFPPAKAHADAAFGISVTRPLEIKLYQSMEHLKAWVYLSMPDEVLGGWNEPGESIKFMADYTRGEERWRGAFAHEYGHVATWELGSSPKRIPWWMAEGAAELAAEAFTRNADRIHTMMLRHADRGTLCAWEELADYDKAEQRVKRMAYQQGQHLMAYVTARFGADARNAWLRAVANATPLDEATRDALGVGFGVLDVDWRRSLSDDQKQPTPPVGD